MPESIDEKLTELTQKLQGLLQDHLLEDSDRAHPYIVQAADIRKFITQCGYLVKYRADLNPGTLALDVIVTVYKPKADMTAEEQALYDKWFFEANGVKNGTDLKKHF